MPENGHGNGDMNMRTLTILAVVAALGGGGGNIAASIINPARQDPWTGSQAKEQAGDLKAFVVAALEMHSQRVELQVLKIEQRLRADMPPEATRRRIQAIETYLRSDKKEPFTAPTYKWQ